MPPTDIPYILSEFYFELRAEGMKVVGSRVPRYVREEIVDDSIARAFERRKTFRDDAATYDNPENDTNLNRVKSWLCQIVSNRLKDYFRKWDTTWVNSSLSFEPASPDPGPVETLLDHEEEDFLKKSLSQMPHQKYASVVRGTLQGITDEEMARERNVSEVTIRNNRSLGVKELRQIIQQSKYMDPSLQ